MDEIDIDVIDFDVIDEASAQSFPASDPPGWATGQLYSAEPEGEASAGETKPITPEGASTSNQGPE